jgi:Putative zinc-finger
MNCEHYQDLLSDFIDGSLAPDEQKNVVAHLSDCSDCTEIRTDLDGMLQFCVTARGQYETVPNEHALWLRISNVIEAESVVGRRTAAPNPGWWFRLMNRSWQLSFPQLSFAAAVIIVMVSLITVISLRGINFMGGSEYRASGLAPSVASDSLKERFRERQEVIAYWNDRVELNKARWNPQMRDTFDKNMKVIDSAVNDSMNQLSRNPHDEVSEEIVNAALNDKVELLKEFATL